MFEISEELFIFKKNCRTPDNTLKISIIILGASCIISATDIVRRLTTMLHISAWQAHVSLQ